MRIILGLIFASIILLGCQKKEPIPVSFYYWKTHFSVDSLAQNIVKDLHSETLYLRYLDVGLVGGDVVPIAPVTIDSTSLTLFKRIVPVVYIKNEVMLEDSIDLSLLVERISSIIESKNDYYSVAISEVQFDCDWSGKSRARYFQFLQDFKAKTNYHISATIRLHQVKYPVKTGIPPVDKGVLMYYNMNAINTDGVNSIYDKNTALQYAKYLSNYDLPLDVALPLFSWAIVNRGGQNVQLMRKVDVADLKAQASLQKINDNEFKVTDAFIYQHVFLKEGDTLRIEQVSQSDVEEMKKQIAQYLPYTPKQIIYYDLDGLNFKNMNYDSKTIKKMGDWY